MNFKTWYVSPGKRTIKDSDDKTCATFDVTHPSGSIAYSLFWRGLANHGGHTLFDVDENRYVVASVNERNSQ